jgi:hypothetical protein
MDNAWDIWKGLGEGSTREEWREQLDPIFRISDASFKSYLDKRVPNRYAIFLRALGDLFNKLNSQLSSEQYIALIKREPPQTEPAAVAEMLPAIRRLTGDYANRDWVCVHVKLKPDHRFDDEIKIRLEKIAGGFGKPIEVTGLDSENVQIELYVMLGQGFLQHLNTLERDLMQLSFVKSVSAP